MMSSISFNCSLIDFVSAMFDLPGGNVVMLSKKIIYSRIAISKITRANRPPPLRRRRTKGSTPWVVFFTFRSTLYRVGLAFYTRDHRFTVVRAVLVGPRTVEENERRCTLASSSSTAVQNTQCMSNCKVINLYEKIHDPPISVL